MTKNKGNTHNYHLFTAISLSLGIVSILLLSSNHLNYAYSETTYFIKSKLNGLVLDIPGSDPRPGAYIQTWPQNNGLGQQWTITGDGFIKSKLNGLVLEIRASNPLPGAFIQTWTQNNGLGQQWTLEKLPESTSDNSFNVTN